MTKKEVVAVIGGYGGMGRLFARVFRDEGYDVIISGPTENKGVKVSEELGVAYSSDNVSAAKKADIVLVSVPIEKTLDVIAEVAPHMKKGGLLMDLTSIKEEPCNAMKKHAGKDVEVIGAHPIFGPRVCDLTGQVIVLTPVRGKRWLKRMKELFEGHKARIIETSPVEHDEIMAVVQGLTHFTYISLGKTLSDLDFDIKKSRQYSSPIYELMLDIVGRIIGQDPHLYAEIQMRNTRVSRIHEVFLEAASELAETINSKDGKKFVTLMADASKHYGDVDRAMGRSDKAINSIVSELETLKASIGRELCITHIYSGKRHLGVITSVTPEEVVLKDKGKTFRLKLSNIRVLGRQEKIEYKTEKYGTTSRDYSVLLDEKAVEEYIGQLLKNFNENVISVQIKDVYRDNKIGDDKKSVCFNVMLVKDNVSDVDESIKDFFNGIGGTLR